MDKELELLYIEVDSYIQAIIDIEEGDHLWSKYELINGYAARLQQIHNDLSRTEIEGKASTELKKFRTMIVDQTIDRFEKFAAFESRKLTAFQLEKEMEKW